MKRWRGSSGYSFAPAVGYLASKYSTERALSITVAPSSMMMGTLAREAGSGFTLWYASSKSCVHDKPWRKLMTHFQCAQFFFLKSLGIPRDKTALHHIMVLYQGFDSESTQVHHPFYPCSAPATSNTLIITPSRMLVGEMQGSHEGTLAQCAVLGKCDLGTLALAAALSQLPLQLIYGSFPQ